MLKAREILRAKYEEKEYQKLVKSLEKPSTSLDLAENAMKSYSNQLSMGLSIIASMATVFVVSYYLAGTAGANSMMQAVSGLVGMIVIMIIEVVLIVIRTNDIDAHVAKRQKAETRKKEKAWGARATGPNTAAGSRLVM